MQGKNSSSTHPRYLPFLLIGLLVMQTTGTLLTSYQSVNSLPESNEKRSQWHIPRVDFETNITDSRFWPSAQGEGVNFSDPTFFEIPNNISLQEMSYEISSLPTEIGDNGTNFGQGMEMSWNGSYDNTTSLGLSGDLTLQQKSSYGEITDFEDVLLSPFDWMGRGHNDDLWHIIQPLSYSYTTSSTLALPNSTYDGQGFLSSRANGDMTANMSGCIVSPKYDTPFFLNNYSLSFGLWSALSDDDAIWVEMRDLNGWKVITPENSYTNVSTLNGTPSNVWSGSMSNWMPVRFQLDQHIQASQQTVDFKICFQTSTTSLVRGGLFVDDVRIHNSGDQKGAWFHGHLSYDYAPNANGRLILPANLSNLSGQLEVEFYANWDIEGGWNDGMQTWLSLDNGSTWDLLSAPIGLPGNGMNWNGQFYQEESVYWIPISYSLPANTSTHPNASNALFRFLVQTDASKNYGGIASSGWEGIAIDDVNVHSNRGTANHSIRQIANFTQSSNGSYGNSSGWLNYSGNLTNEWQWTNLLGANGPWTDREAFDGGYLAPAGWSVWTKDTRKWDVGPVSNASGYGPGAWPSGSNGMGIYLTNKYTSNMYTHLYSPQYYIPENATAHVVFKSWACTEFAWDGGAVSISTDGGETWWYLPPNVPNFHDQLSTVNPGSPFYNQGIIDGSTVSGGCGSPSHTFETKTADVSNLSGEYVKVRFSFFSDTFVEGDGWYIDDAGIEIDEFEPNGTWISDVITPSNHFYTNFLDGRVSEVNGTTARFDILYANGSQVIGLDNQTLPVNLSGLKDIPLRIRVKLSTNSDMYTPRIHHLNIGSSTFITPYHLKYSDSRIFSANNFVFDDPQGMTVSSGSNLVHVNEWNCYMRESMITVHGDNVSLTSWGMQVQSSTWHESPSPHKKYTVSSTNVLLSQVFHYSFNYGQEVEYISFEPKCLEYPRDVVIDVAGFEILNTTNWAFEGEFLHNTYGDRYFINLTRDYHLAQDFATFDYRGFYYLPLNISTSQGGVELTVYLNGFQSMTDVVTSRNSATRFVPGDTVSYYSTSAELDYLVPVGYPANLTNIHFYLSPTPLIEDAVVELRLDDPFTNPVVRQIQGSGLASYNEESSYISCLQTILCDIQWSLDVHWLMDDIADLHAIVISYNDLGLSAGPGTYVERTNYNAIENDLEIVDFSVSKYDENSSLLVSDYLNSQWPFHIDSNETLNANGRVRFEGYSGQWIGLGDAEIGIELTAVAAKNKSGGPDEWLGEPVNWSQIWNGSVDADGRFNISIQTPGDELPRGVDIEIRPKVIRRGPIDENTTTSEDMTADSVHTRFTLDYSSSQVTGLYVVDPGGVVPADGHIWMKGQDIPTRLLLEDSEGLGDSINMYYWFERTSDSNGNSYAEKSEYQVKQVSLIRSATSDSIDLPLLDDFPAIRSHPNGEVHIFFEGVDLAGNQLVGGGSHDSPLAIITVSEDYQTILDTGSFEFDIENGLLYPAKEHSFSFNFSDNNGIESLDKIQLSLLGREVLDDCLIEYEPRFAITIYDEECFIEKPEIVVSELKSRNSWNVEITFRLDWFAANTFAYQGGIPSLKIYDEGNDLGLGASRIEHFEWSMSEELELRRESISDLTSPYSSIDESGVSIQLRDEIEFSYTVYHANSDHPALDLPNETYLEIQLTDFERESITVAEVDANGTSRFTIMIDPITIQHNYGQVVVSLEDAPFFVLESSITSISIDEDSPMLILPQGSLEKVSSNAMQDVEVIIMIEDDQSMPDQVLLNWQFTRLGQAINNSQGQQYLELSASSSSLYTYLGDVDFSSQAQLQKDDKMQVWVTVSDNSGRELIGFGSESDPISPLFEWVAFEPKFEVIRATPYRPVVGENIQIDVQVSNTGLLSGNVELQLLDGEGSILQSRMLNLGSNEFIDTTWNLEAWQEGRLGLVVVLTNYSGDVPVPLSEVTAYVDESNDGQGEMLGLSLLILFATVAGLYVVLQKRKAALEEMRVRSLERALNSKRQPSLPPPRPDGLGDDGQEE